MGWKCRTYTMRIYRHSDSSLCVARLADLPLSPEDRKSLAKFDATENLGAEPSPDWPKPMDWLVVGGIGKKTGYAGFPIRTTSGGFKATVTSIRQTDIPPAMFEIPKHYRLENPIGLYFYGMH